MPGVELFFFYLFAVAAPLSIAALNAAQAGLSLFFLARLFTGKWRPSLPSWFLIAWFVWCTLCAFMSPLRAEALNGVLNFWSWTAFFTASALPPAIRAKLERWTTYLAVSILLTLPASVTEFFLGTDIFHHQTFSQKVPVGSVNAYGYFSHHLTYAGSMVIGVCVLSAALLYGPSRGRFLRVVGIAGAVAGVVMSLARSYFFGLAAALPVLLWPKGKKLVAQIAGAALAAGVLLAVLGPAPVRARFKSLGDMKNASNAERVYLWKAAVRQIGDRPLAGWGPGTYEKTAGPYKAPYARFVQYPDLPLGFKTKGHCHNLYLMVAQQTGIPGLLLFAAFLGAAIFKTWRQDYPALKWGTLSAIAAFLVGGLFEYNGGDVEVATLLFFLLGMACGKGEVSRGVGD